MALTYTEKLGFARELLEVIKSNKDALKKGSLVPDDMVKTLTAKIDANVGANDEQESLKSKLKEATKAVKEKDRDMYVTASSYLDMVAGALKKDSPAAQVIKRLRSKIRAKKPSGKSEESKPKKSAE